MEDFQKNDIEQEILRQRQQLSELLAKFEGKALEERLDKVEGEFKEFFGEEAWGHVKGALKEGGFVGSDGDPLIEEMESAPIPFAKTEPSPERLNEQDSTQARPLPPEVPIQREQNKKENVPYVPSDEVTDWKRDHGKSYVDTYTPRPLPPEIELGDSGLERPQDRQSKVPKGKEAKAQDGQLTEQEDLLAEFESRMRELNEVNSDFHRNLIDFLGTMSQAVMDNATEINRVRMKFMRRAL